MTTVLSPTGGAKTVATPGTAVAMVAAETRAMQVVFQAKEANTGNVYVGDSNVDKTTSPQVTLGAGESLTVEAPYPGMYIDLNEWFVDADTATEGVDFLYVR